MKQQIVIIFTLLFCSCANNKNKPNTPTAKHNPEKIQVLNFGTFHFGSTSDANKTVFDEESDNSKIEIRKIAQLIAQFQPTIICVEKLPVKNIQLNQDYQEYLQNPADLSTKDGEISMLAFEVGRLCNVSKIYGIDNHMGYNYSVGDFIESSPDYENSIDPTTYLELTNDPMKNYPGIAEKEKRYDSLSLLEKLNLINEPAYLDYSINMNADKLLYVGIDDGFEGADNAAIFYHRNMKIYSNLNRIKMNKEDRIFILMGAAHTAFLKEFIKRSPKFEMVNTVEYLNSSAIKP